MALGQSRRHGRDYSTPCDAMTAQIFRLDLRDRFVPAERVSSLGAQMPASCSAFRASLNMLRIA
jgi:hypothetical protein